MKSKWDAYQIPHPWESDVDGLPEEDESEPDDTCPECDGESDERIARLEQDERDLQNRRRINNYGYDKGHISASMWRDEEQQIRALEALAWAQLTMLRGWAVKPAA